MGFNKKKTRESLPNKYQTSNNPCDLIIIYSYWERRTNSLINTEMVLVSNKNATAKQKYEANREFEAADFDFDPWNIMNDSDENSFIPP